MPHIIAHRGDSAHYPENTELAFTSALELGVDGVECDIRLTRCGTLVCIHDPRIDRVSDGTGLVSALTLEQLQRYNFGSADAPQGPLTFDRLLELIDAHPSTHLFVETKHFSRYGRIVEEQLALRLRYFGMLERPNIHIISFSPLAMRRMRQLAPKLHRIYLLSPRGRAFADWGKPHAYGASISEKQPQSYMWTIDEPEDMQWAATHGVDFLATNKPALARHVLGAQ